MLLKVYDFFSFNVFMINFYIICVCLYKVFEFVLRMIKQKDFGKVKYNVLISCINKI